jgi:2-polyprenyl-3-methyl-5-hydroxy-6-metoxy-1,4-benzoquinol methylase
MKNEEHSYSVKINMKTENSSHTKILKKITSSSNVLEIGPGDGSMTNYLKNQLKCTVDCIEIDEKYKEKLSLLARRITIADLEKIDYVELIGEIKYDYIIFADVLEHLYNPWNVLNQMKFFLKEQGSILASIPNISNGAIVLSLMNGFFNYSEKGLLDKTHIRFFTRYSIYELFEKSGLNIKELDTTKIQPENTELYGYFNHLNLPNSTKDLIYSMKDYDTYQFIVEAKLKNNETKKSEESKNLKFKIDLNEIQILKNEIESFKNSRAYKLAKLILRLFGKN